MSIRTAASGASGALTVPRPADVGTAREFLRAYRDVLGLDDPDAEARFEREESDDIGQRHFRFEQVFNGLPVWPGAMVVHVGPAGTVDGMNGAYVRTPRDLVLAAAVSAEQAAAVAQSAVPGGETAPVTPPELIIYGPLDREARLAWKMEVAVSLTARWLVIVDAQSGAILTSFNQVADVTQTGSGADLFGTTRALNVWNEGGTFHLVDVSKAMYDPTSTPPATNSTRGGIIILDARNQPPTDNPDRLPELFPITSADPNSGWLNHGVSAAFGLSETYDYYLQRHNRNSIDGQGGTMLAAVRLGVGLQNAFWSNGMMLFGDAHPYPGALDAAAHEMTHGVTEKTANLVYQGQAGALNEAMSDIFGENVEARTFGGPDWKKGAQILDPPIQNYANCGAISYGPNIPYPSRMSEYVNTSQDNGGVHGNSCIINHAYYLLAVGLNDALGMVDAERIFYRALTTHLVRNSQFVDARLACVQSADELFGAGSRQAQRTAEAFDAVEIFAGGATADPVPFPTVNAPDSTLFLYVDSNSGQLGLGRREDALGDPSWGVPLSCSPVAQKRPAVSGDGTLAVFVRADNALCLIETNSAGCEECLAGSEGLGYSVAMSPDGKRFAAVLRDELGQPDNAINVVDVVSGAVQRFELRAALVDGQAIGTVAYAETMEFTADGRFLLYDALNVIPIGNGTDLNLWSIFALDLANDRTLTLLEPVQGMDIGNPALSQTSDNFLAFDVVREQKATVLAMNLNTGETAEVATITGPLGVGVPSYTGDDAAIVYTQGDPGGGISLLRQTIASRVQPAGSPATWLSEAALGVIYRRGAFVGPAATATPTTIPTSRPTSTATASPTRTPPAMTATASATLTVIPTRTMTASPTTPPAMTATATSSRSPTVTQPPSNTVTVTPQPSTATHGPTATHTRSATPGSTVLVTSPTATVTPTPQSTAVASATAGFACEGDCNHDQRVTVDELLAGMDLALGRSTATVCTGFDTDKSGRVTVDELVVAVDAALRGCARILTPLATAAASSTATTTSTTTRTVVVLNTATPLLTAIPTNSRLSTPTGTVTAVQVVTHTAAPTATMTPAVTLGSTQTRTATAAHTGTQTPVPPTPTITATGTVDLTAACAEVALPAYQPTECEIVLIEPKPCQEIDLTNGKTQVFGWATNNGIWCETPWTLLIAGNPATESNLYYWGNLNTSQDGISHYGGYVFLSAEQIGRVTSTNGIYHWVVRGWFGSHPQSQTFRVKM